MHFPKAIKKFTDRHPLIGPLMWISSIQYLVVQTITAMAWKTVPYSWANNMISDLGNTTCSLFKGRGICSPLHDLMNVSFVIMGVTMFMGSVLIYQELRKKLSLKIGFSLMALAGIGFILVGLFPENISAFLHSFGAFLIFTVSNVSLVVLGLALSLHMSDKIRWCVILSGLIALIAAILPDYLGVGGMERLIVYPQTIWIIIFGTYMFIKRSKVKKV